MCIHQILKKFLKALSASMSSSILKNLSPSTQRVVINQSIRMNLSSGTFHRHENTYTYIQELFHQEAADELYDKSFVHVCFEKEVTVQSEKLLNFSNT